MRKLAVLCGMFFLLAVTSAAQDSAVGAVGFDAGSSSEAPADPPQMFSSDRLPWQLGIGYQYLHFSNIHGRTFNNHGLNTSLTRYLNNWFGLEGAVVAGFGSIAGTPNIGTNSLFFGAGPHITVTNDSRLEPWVHVLAGGQHFQRLRNITSWAFIAGGGIDIKLGGRGYWRIQGAYVGTHFPEPGNIPQQTYSFGTGLVLNF